MNNELIQDKYTDPDPEQSPSINQYTYCAGFTPNVNKLHVYNWLHDFPEMEKTTLMVEVQFKNTRKSYYINSNKLPLKIGDMVAVEAVMGHDIGMVTLTGKLVECQMKKNNVRFDTTDPLKRVYRIARAADLEKYEQAKAREQSTMIRSREIAESLGLQMKIGDVEYQGDGNKAIFYYIADERVDFRQLIKVLAAEFRVKIEMKQIGVRQEAGRIGGIGPCGREMCCSGWLTDFMSVSTSAARYQDLSINPQKLAGQCGKLKCCINFEVDAYVEAHRSLPSQEIVLYTKDKEYHHLKTDVFSGKMTYSTDKNTAANLETISKERAFEVIALNRKGINPDLLNPNKEPDKHPLCGNSDDLLKDNRINRFDPVAPKRSKRPRKKVRKNRNIQSRNKNNSKRDERQK